jgi:hypothetical protein
MCDARNIAQVSQKSKIDCCRFVAFSFVAGSLLKHYSLLHYLNMTGQAKVESLIRQVADLPEEAQAQLARSIAERIYHVDDDAEPARA